MGLFSSLWNSELAQLRAAVAGDAAAVRALVKSLNPRAMSLALRMLGGREDAEDVVQESFLQLWRLGVNFKGESSLSTYFYTIVSRKCLDCLGQRKEHVGLDEDEVPYLLDSAVGVEAALCIEQDGQEMLALLNRLLPRQRMAIILWAYHDETVAEIGVKLGIPTNAAHQLLHRAKQNLKQLLLQEGGKNEFYE